MSIRFKNVLYYSYFVNSSCIFIDLAIGSSESYCVDLECMCLLYMPVNRNASLIYITTHI